MNITKNIIAPLLSVAAFTAFAALAPVAARAADVGGVKVEDKAMVGGQELALNGAGVRTRLVFKVYVGALYLPQKTSNVADIVG